MHLADLHLGKFLLEQSLIEDQRYILKEIKQIVQEQAIDAVMICGDVYDKAVPSIEAVRLFSEFLTELYHLKVKVLVISGNHDSKDRLSFGNELFIDNGVYIEGVFHGCLRKVTFQDEYGDINVYMLPFVKPIDVRKYYPEEFIDSYQDSINCIIKNTEIDLNERNIIMVHQFVTANGVEIERSDSEIISLGGIDNVDVLSFSDFDYVAMGHVHKAQKLLRDTARYAGSPLKYSFSEVFQKKSVPIINLHEKGNIEIELVPLVPVREMRKIMGKLEQLIDKDIVNGEDSNDYIQAILTNEDYVMDVIGKLRNVYPNILRLEYQNTRTTSLNGGKNSASGDITKRSEFELFQEFYQNQNHVEFDDERVRIVNKIIKEIKDND